MASLDFYDTPLLHSKIVSRRNPVRSLIILFYFYFDFLNYDFFDSATLNINNILIPHYYYNYLDEESDMLIYNYYENNGTIKTSFKFTEFNKQDEKWYKY